MTKPIRVGIIGLNPGIHWAALAHMPALTPLADEQLTVRGPRGDATELSEPMPPAEAYAGWTDTPVARNVARTYALVARDIREGTRLAPGFGDAVALHETLEAIERSAAARSGDQP
ncbi:hypothetical protein [Luteimonas sp. MC1825]|uniref:hypothetical protein n=1 Tax=Luteimonas sp. MC1825 TaxID=2761107 RepID=UPI001622B6A4|nr:hypothetical protein [Luteimonas sp. MC1825]MBB6598140.1 hypothetical protein [Luteimonas sp. MC1825]QOC88372.1 hypothetical protein IDM46_00915 [Luteimonas sp. MC1825]